MLHMKYYNIHVIMHGVHANDKSMHAYSYILLIVANLDQKYTPKYKIVLYLDVPCSHEGIIKSRIL